MKVALVVHDFDPGVGHGRYALEIARRVAASVEVHVLANRFAGQLPQELRLHHVPAWRRWAITSVLTFLVSSERILRRQQFDLVHAQGLTCGRADVITGHICNAARYQRQPPAGLRQRWFPWLIVPLEWRFYRQPRARHLIAISQKLRAEIQAHYTWNRPVSVIYHGTDTGYFCPAESEGDREKERRRYALPPTAWVWLFVGEAVKGLKEVIAQLPAFPEAVLLVISRSGLDHYRAEASGLGVADRVRFWGPEPSPLRAYQAADALIYPSTYDAFGLVVSEAMACALPVVVGRGIGAAEWIEPERNGLLCDPSRSETLRQQLDWLCQDPARARALGCAGRQTVKGYSWDRCASETLAVYEHLAPGLSRASG